MVKSKERLKNEIEDEFTRGLTTSTRLVSRTAKRKNYP